MKNILTTVALGALLALGLTACNDDDKPNGPVMPDNTIQNIVTLSARTDNGLTFTYQKNYDTPVVTYTAGAQTLDAKVFPVGNRLMLSYVPQNGDPDVSGDITIWGASIVYNAQLLYGDPQDYVTWRGHEIIVTSMWIADGWLNLNGKFVKGANVKNLQLYCDRASLDTANPQLYMVYTPDRDDVSLEPKQAFAAFDIHDLLARPDLRTVTVHVANLTGPDDWTYQIRQGFQPNS